MVLIWLPLVIYYQPKQKGKWYRTPRYQRFQCCRFCVVNIGANSTVLKSFCLFCKVNYFTSKNTYIKIYTFPT